MLFTETFPAPVCVAGYWPTGSEFDPRPLMQAVQNQGGRLALPVIDSEAMSFRYWIWGQELEIGPYGIAAPPPDAPLAAPDIVIAPLIAMGRDGHRLGQGGGYYDRAIAVFRSQNHAVTVVGLGYDGQLLETVPHEAHDARLDYVLTPNTVLRVKD